jgi:hypothetical protein
MSLEKLDDFLFSFTTDMEKLIDYEHDKNKLFSKDHYNLFDKLFSILKKRNKYGIDKDLWTLLYYHSIYFYSKVEKIGNIPTTLVTKHNHILSFYMKQNIGKLNTTIVHFDTHPDMNSVKNSYTLPILNKKYVDSKDEKYIEECQKIVWDIGSAISGVLLTTGIQNYVWCMPEWIPDSNVSTTFFLKNNKKTIGMYTNDEKFRNDELVDITYSKNFKGKDDKLYIKLQTHVRKNKIINEIIEQTVDNNYILDIDLDYFVCNGRKLNKTEYYREPYDLSSSHRTKTIVINEDNPRNFYEKGDGLDIFEKELQSEIKLINKRMKFFISLIKELKHRGYTPSHISICDSTNILTSICYKCNSLSNGYVPTFFALYIHDYIYNGLKDIFY